MDVLVHGYFSDHQQKPHAELEIACAPRPPSPPGTSLGQLGRREAVAQRPRSG